MLIIHLTMQSSSSFLALQLILALEWKDASRDYLDVLAATFDHPSYLELDNNAQVNGMESNRTAFLVVQVLIHLFRRQRFASLRAFVAFQYCTPY